MKSTQQSSLLAAPAEAVWQHVTTPEGINEELRPWLRMTMPKGVPDGLAVTEPTRDLHLGRSYLLLFGLLPVDYDDITLGEIDPPRAFRERSTMLTMRAWHHDRVIEPVGDGCRVTDTLRFELRCVPFASGLVRPIVSALFRHRHRALRRRFGSVLSPAGR